MLTPSAGGSGQQTGRGPDAVVGQVIPANSVVFRGAPARTTERGNRPRIGAWNYAEQSAARATSSSPKEDQ